MKAFNFEGKGFEYFKIWIVNILLTIVTVGLYYPWAKVRNNRYFYANSTLEGRNFEYHATGKQLFIGYLISMVLLIIYIAIQNVSPAGSGIILLLFFAALPWIIWRSLKFNMRVTSFSNVRFGFEGTPGGAYFNYLLMPILFFLSLYAAPILIGLFASVFSNMGVISGVLGVILFIAGIALAVYVYAVMKKKMYSYVINGSRYGQGVFTTQLEIAPFAKIALKTVGLLLLSSIGYLIVVGIIAMVIGASGSLLGLAGGFDDPEAIEQVFDNPAIFVLLALVYAGFIFISIAVFAYSSARQRAYVYDNTQLDGKIAFESTLEAGSLAWVSVTNLLLIAITLGLATPWAAVRMARLYLDNTEVDTRIGFDEYVTQKQQEQSSLGEQIGDAFDVQVGIGL